VELARGLLDGGDGDLVRELGVECLRGAIDGRSLYRLDARHLAERMDARVRPAGDGQFVP